MSNLTEKYVALKEKITKKRNLLNKHSQDLKILLAKCPHEEIEVKEYYYSGSYYDKAYTEYSTVCKLCGKTLSTNLKEHSWYG